MKTRAARRGGARRSSSATRLDATLHDLLLQADFRRGSGALSAAARLGCRDLAASRSHDVAAFAKRAFRSGNAVLALTGNVDAPTIAAVTDGSGDAPMDAPFDSALVGRLGRNDRFGCGDRRWFGVGRSADRRPKGGDRARLRRPITLPRANRRSVAMLDAGNRAMRT